MSVNPDVLLERTRGARAGLWRLAGPWWLFLLTAIAWLIIAWVALRFTPASIATVGVLLGVLFLFGMLDEFLIASVRSNWRWLHVAMGVIFAFGAGWSFARPYDAFWTLASILGLLLIFRGTLDIISSVDARGINSAWWPASWRSCSASGPPSSTCRSKGRCCWCGSGCSPCSAGSPRSSSPSKSAAANGASSKRGHAATLPHAHRPSQVIRSRRLGPVRRYPLAPVACLAWTRLSLASLRRCDEDAQGRAWYYLGVSTLDAGTRCFQDTPFKCPARSAFESFLQLAGDLVGRGLYRALHDLGGLGKRLVESLFDGRLANRDEPCLVSGELLSRVMQLLAG